MTSKAFKPAAAPDSPVAAPEPRDPAVRLVGDALHIGAHFRLSFNRTLRLPDDGQSYPLPPGLGLFPLKRVEDYASRVPGKWLERGGFFLPMYQREALWLRLAGDSWHPAAVKMYAGGINAATGGSVTEGLHAEPQDYMVVPYQPWLDGFKTEDGRIRQFVAMPLGMGYTAEGQITGKETTGGMQFLVYAPKAGRFPEEEPERRRSGSGIMRCASLGGPIGGGFMGDMDMDMVSEQSVGASGESYGATNAAFTVASAGTGARHAAQMKGAAMGLGGGGRMEQKIYQDTFGLDTWDEESVIRVDIYIVNSMMYREITGENAPECPVTPETYAQYGYPWFALYDENKTDVSVSEELKGLKSISEMDKANGFDVEDDSPVPVARVVQMGHGGIPG